MLVSIFYNLPVSGVKQRNMNRNSMMRGRGRGRGGAINPFVPGHTRVSILFILICVCYFFVFLLSWLVEDSTCNLVLYFYKSKLNLNL